MCRYTARELVGPEAGVLYSFVFRGPSQLYHSTSVNESLEEEEGVCVCGGGAVSAIENARIFARVFRFQVLANWGEKFLCIGLSGLLHPYPGGGGGGEEFDDNHCLPRGGRYNVAARAHTGSLPIFGARRRLMREDDEESHLIQIFRGEVAWLIRALFLLRAIKRDIVLKL